MSSNPVILEYLFSTFPSQLQVSTGSTPASGRIGVSVSGGNTDKYCKQIRVAVPIGPGATDFSEKSPSAAVNTANWSLSSQEIMTGEELGLNDEVGAPYATFTFDAKDSSVYKINYNLVLSLTGIVNTEVGSFAYIVRETSGTDASTMTEKQSTFTLDKVTPSFYLENFVAKTTSSPLAPATEFANGTAIRLAWESNGTWFQVYEKNNTKPIYTGPGKTCEVSGGAKTDTTLFLQASMTGDPGDDTGKFEPIYLFDSITITISNPDLTPASVECSGGISGTTLKATGTATLSDVAASGTLKVSGQTTLAGLTAGDTTVNQATINDSMTVRNGVMGVYSTGVELCNASDYSLGTVGIGNYSVSNVKLYVRNNQSTGYGIYLDSSNVRYPWWALCVEGPCINTYGTWSQLSDMNLKEHVRPFNHGLAHVLQINPIRYHFKEEMGLAGSKDEHVGVSAQELQEFAPYMVGKARLKPDGNDEYLTVDNGPMTYMLVNAIKEQQAMITDLQDRMDTLEKELSRISNPS